MKPKNVMLLGFVNRAVEYLDKHMDEQPDARLAELKNIDLASLRDELTDNLDTSLGTMQSTMATLLKAGNEAFDKFVDNASGTTSIVNEFDRLFDADFDDKNKNNQKELAKLLSFYNLDNDFEFADDEEIIVPDKLTENNDAIDAVIDEQKDVPVLDEKVFDQENKQEPIKNLDALDTLDGGKNIFDDMQEENEQFNSSPEDDKYLQEIIRNATSQANAVFPIGGAVEELEAIDSIFSEIVKHEDYVPDNDTAIKIAKAVRQIQNTQDFDKQINKQDKIVEDKKQEVENEYYRPLYATYIENPAIDKVPAETIEIEKPVKEPTVEEKVKEEVKVEEPVNVATTYIENPGIDEVPMEEEKVETTIAAKEVIVKDIEKVATQETKAVGKAVTQETKPVEEKTYVNSLIDDLKVQLQKQEEQKKQIEEKNKETYERISKYYQYLPAGFIRMVYDLKDELKKEYQANEKVIVLHRVKFDDVDNLRKFVEIGLNHQYQINADEQKMIVDIFKEFVNSDNKIMSNIYEIANQGYLLNGEYEGYNVIVNEEEEEGAID